MGRKANGVTFNSLSAFPAAGDLRQAKGDPYPFDGGCVYGGCVTEPESEAERRQRVADLFIAGLTQHP